MKVSLYARVSTEKQEKQETIQSQLGALREFANENNYTVVSEYIDQGYSGAMLNRPELDKLRDDAAKKLFDAVLIHSPDRLARKFAYQELIREELKKHRVHIVFLNRPQSSDSPEDHLLNGVQGLIAEYEKAKIIERTRRGKLHKAKIGQLVSSIAPYGYKYIPQDKVNKHGARYELVPEEATIVKLIFDLFVKEQMSIRGIAKELTKRGIPPRKGKHWRTSTLHRIIRNTTYYGITYYNKHIAKEPVKPQQEGIYKRRQNTSLHLRPKNEWIPIKLPEDLKIIDKEVFEAAQKQLRKNSEFSPRNVKHQYLLRGLLQCGECGSPLFGTPCHDKLFYRCGNRHRKFPLPKECYASMRNAPMLEEIVWNALSEAIQQPKLIVEQIRKMQSKSSIKSKTAEKELERIETSLLKTQDEEDRLLDAYRNQVISMEQLKSQMEKIQQKKEMLDRERQKMNEIRGQNAPTSLLKKSVRETCNVLKKRLKKLSFEEKQQILRLLVNCIVVEKGQLRIRGVIPLYAEAGNIASTTSF